MRTPNEQRVQRNAPSLSYMTAAINLARTELSEEERLEMGARVTASLNEAQVAWDTYRQRLAEHGIGTEQS
jgi:uncharacterized protein YciW